MSSKYGDSSRSGRGGRADARASNTRRQPKAVGCQPPAPPAGADLWVGAVRSTGSYRERLQARGQETMQMSHAPAGRFAAPPLPRQPGHKGGYGAANSHSESSCLFTLPAAPPLVAPPVPGRWHYYSQDSGSMAGSESPCSSPTDPSPPPAATAWQMAGGMHLVQQQCCMPCELSMTHQPSSDSASTATSGGSSPKGGSSPWPQGSLLAVLMPDSGHLSGEEIAEQLRAAAPDCYEE